MPFDAIRCGLPRLGCEGQSTRDPVPALAPVLFEQLHLADGHAPVHGLAHVVNGEQGSGAGGEGFHFHAGLAVGFGLRHTTKRDLNNILRV